MNNDDNVCRAYFCMMLVEGVLVEGEGALVGVEGGMPVTAKEGARGATEWRRANSVRWFNGNLEA